MVGDTQANLRWAWGWQFWVPVAVVVLAGAVTYALLRGGWASEVLIAYWPWLLVIAGVAAVLFCAWWLWWQLPKRQARRFDLADDKARADVEDNFRKTVGQLLGGAAVLVGAGFAYLQFTQQQRSAHDLLISNQVSKGFELLGNKDGQIGQRLGGIYALEGVMNTSEEYHRPVLEALCAFVRDYTKGKKDDTSPATDVQAALTVIGRRDPSSEQDLFNAPVDLAGAHIPKVLLLDANLSLANLRDADLGAADLTLTNLSAANLGNTNLSAAMLTAADLNRAYLGNANLSGANLNGARLNGARLSGANLSGANLIAADLTDAYLDGANLSGANFLGGAIGLAQSQLDSACGDEKTRLARPLTIKPCPKQ